MIRPYQIDEREEWAAIGRRNRPRFDPRLAFRFKLTLEGIDPPIWRRIEVQDSSLEVFSCILVLAMGWESDFEPHRLTIDGRHFGPKSTYGIPAAEGVEDETAVTLSSLFPVGSPPRTGSFEFEPNASWKHELEFEGHVRVDLGVDYPRLIEGERACPPDSTRGLEGYHHLLDQTMDDKLEDRAIPKRPRQLLFDPEAYDLSQIQHRLRFVDRKLAGYVHWCPPLA